MSLITSSIRNSQLNAYFRWVQSHGSHDYIVTDASSSSSSSSMGISSSSSMGVSSSSSSMGISSSSSSMGLISSSSSQSAWDGGIFQNADFDDASIWTDVGFPGSGSWTITGGVANGVNNGPPFHRYLQQTFAYAPGGQSGFTFTVTVTNFSGDGYLLGYCGTQETTHITADGTYVLSTGNTGGSSDIGFYLHSNSGVTSCTIDKVKLVQIP